jgi:hypothetical protein
VHEVEEQGDECTRRMFTGAPRSRSKSLGTKSLEFAGEPFRGTKVYLSDATYEGCRRN